MSHHLEPFDHLDDAMRECIANCSDCHDACTATLVHGLAQGGELAAAELIRTLLDCAQACDTSRDMMLRGSPLHVIYCRGCAHACGSCAAACERFPDDPVMTACAEVCRRCLESCRAMGGEDRH
jgi:hypothetical protein